MPYAVGSIWNRFGYHGVSPDGCRDIPLLGFGYHAVLPGASARIAFPIIWPRLDFHLPIAPTFSAPSFQVFGFPCFSHPVHYLANFFHLRFQQRQPMILAHVVKKYGECRTRSLHRTLRAGWFNLVIHDFVARRAGERGRSAKKFRRRVK